MNCAKARAQFSAYVEQELSESDRRGVSTHLGRCDECSRDLFAMQKAVNLLRWVPKVDARPGFEDRLSERLHAAPAARRSPWAWLEPVRELGERLEAGARMFLGETLVATPASALLLAVLVGTGGGALVMHQVMRSGGQTPAELAASTPEIMSAPGIGASTLPPAPSATAADVTVAPPAPALVASNAGAVPPPAGAQPATDNSQLAAADRARPETPAAGSRPSGSVRRSTRRAIEAPVVAVSEPGRTRPGMEVAPWAKNQQPIEGPPSVSQVEYILDLVDVNQERVLQLPASAVVSGGTVTF